jgi:hypothetical protein
VGPSGDVGGGRTKHITAKFVLLSVIFFAVSCTSQPATVDPSPHNSIYTDPKLGWSWRYPSSWHLQTFSGMIGRGFLEGVLITNLDHGFHHPDCGTGCSTSLWDMHGTPDDLVAIELHCIAAGPQPRPSIDNVTFPLSLADFNRSRTHPSYGAPLFLWKPLLVHGVFAVYVWFGHEANAQQKTAASHIVSSITKPTTGCG